MSACHAKTSAPSSPAAMQRLRDFLEDRRESTAPVADFEEFEKQMHRMLCQRNETRQPAGPGG